MAKVLHPRNKTGTAHFQKIQKITLCFRTVYEPKYSRHNIANDEKCASKISRNQPKYSHHNAAKGKNVAFSKNGFFGKLRKKLRKKLLRGCNTFAICGLVMAIFWFINGSKIQRNFLNFLKMRCSSFASRMQYFCYLWACDG